MHRLFIQPFPCHYEISKFPNLYGGALGGDHVHSRETETQKVANFQKGFHLSVHPHLRSSKSSLLIGWRCFQTEP